MMRSDARELTPLGRILIGSECGKLMVPTISRTLLDRILVFPCLVVIAPLFLLVRCKDKLFSAMKRNTVKTAVSHTALAVCHMRALADLNGYFEDPFAIHLLPFAWKIEAYFYHAASIVFPDLLFKLLERGSQVVRRTRFFDDCVINSRVSQVVILGAGFDSRAHRLFKLNNPKSFGVHVFEVDAPLIQLKKQERMDAIMRRLDTFPVQYVPVNFAENESFMDKLIEAGFEPAVKSIFLLEGVARYLTWHELKRTLEQIPDYCTKGTLLAMNVSLDTWTKPEKALQYAELHKIAKWTKSLGEESKFGMDEDLDTPANKFLPLGFASVDVWLGPQAIQNQYKIQDYSNVNDGLHFVVLSV